MRSIFLFAAVLMFSLQSFEGECSIKKNTPALQKAKEQLLNSRQRTDVINYLIEENNYQKYLEIGVADGANLGLIKAPYKWGVDPSTVAGKNRTHTMTSDEFFQQNKETFDIIFIDGLHLHEQVLKDVTNSLNCLNPGGIIVMHDCMPQEIQHQFRNPIPGAWNGDVWKAAAFIRMHLANVHFCVLDMDWGCGILTPNSTQPLFPEMPIEYMDWNYYIQNRKQLLNIKSVEEWLNNR